MAGDEVILFGALAFDGIGVQRSLHLCHVGRVAAQGFDISFFVVHVGVIVGEATLVAVDVRVTARTIHLVMQSFTGTALATTPCDVLSADLVLGHTQTARSCRWSRLVPN